MCVCRHKETNKASIVHTTCATQRFVCDLEAKGEHEEEQITKSSERPLQKHFNAEIETTSQKISNILNPLKTKRNSNLGPKQSVSETRELYDLVKNLFFNPTPGIGVLNSAQKNDC